MKRTGSADIPRLLPLLLALAMSTSTGCSEKKSNTAAPEAVHKHEHVPPHHGTPVVLGNEEYHLELVQDVSARKLVAYVLDGEMEQFIRIQAESFQVAIKGPGKQETLLFKAVANPATGEKVGDTSMFEAQSDWLGTNRTFDAVIKQLPVRDTTYTNVEFNFPKGNDTDSKDK